MRPTRHAHSVLYHEIRPAPTGGLQARLMDDGSLLREFDLPRESRLLQGLARRVLADEHLAADVAQETWLTLLRGRTRELSSPRHFAKRVAHNIAVDVVRSKDRRRQREERHVRPTVAPAADELAHASNVRERMLEALEDLSPKYREVLRLRYYESLGPPAIAEHLDVPLETVRTRLKRGMAQLKRRLEREFREDPAGWPWALGLVLPAGELGRFALGPAASAGAATGAASAAASSASAKLGGAGALAARRGLLALVALVPIAILAAVVWAIRGAPEDASSTALGPPPLVGAPAVAAAAAPRDEVADTGGRATLTTPVRVEVVLDDDGSPLPRQALTLRWGDGQELSTETDDEGVVETAVPFGALLLVDLDETEATPSVRRSFEVTPAEGAASFAAVVRVGSLRSLQGRVLDLAGAPVAGARVVAYEEREDMVADARAIRRARTDSRGGFRLAGLPETFIVRAFDRDRVSFVALRARGVNPADFTGIDFTLAPSGAFEGSVVDDEGRPLEGVEVSVRSANSKVAVNPDPDMQFVKPFRRVETDRKGRFAVPGLPHGRYTVTASLPPLMSDWQSLDLERDLQSLSLAMRTGEDVTVRVMDTRNKPVEGARVTIWRGHAPGERDFPYAHPMPEQRLESEGDGTASFGGQLANAPLLVIVNKEGYGLQTLGPYTPPLDLEVRLEPARALQGRLVDASGRPPAEAKVILRTQQDFQGLIEQGLDRWNEQSLSDGEVEVGADGRFACDAAPHGPLSILTVARTQSGATLVQETSAAADATQVEIVLRPVWTFEGRVTDARTSEPLEGVRVIAFSAATGTRWDATTDATGSYVSSLPEAPDWNLVFEHPEYARTTVTPPGPGTIDQALEPPCRLMLTIVDAEAVPVSSARVELRTERGDPILTGPREGRGFEPADPLGRVLVTDAPAARLVAYVFVPRLAEPYRFPLDLSEGLAQERRLVLEDFVSSAPTLPVAVHLRAVPGLAEPRWEWSRPDGSGTGYVGPVTLVARDARGHRTLEVTGHGTPRAVDAEPGTSCDLAVDTRPNPLNLRRVAALEAWPGSSAWGPLPFVDPLSAVPLPAGRGSLALVLGAHELTIPLGGTGPRGAELTVYVPR